MDVKHFYSYSVLIRKFLLRIKHIIWSKSGQGQTFSGYTEITGFIYFSKLTSEFDYKKSESSSCADDKRVQVHCNHTFLLARNVRDVCVCVRNTINPIYLTDVSQIFAGLCSFTRQASPAVWSFAKCSINLSTMAVANLHWLCHNRSVQ